MTEAGIKILERIKSIGTFTISGNSGGYEELLFINDKFYSVGGFGAVEEYRNEISEENALNMVKRKLIMEHRFSNKDISISTDAEVLAYWTK